MRPLNSIRLRFSSFPLDILLDLCLSTILLSAFKTGSSSMASRPTWIKHLGYFRKLLTYRKQPLVLILLLPSHGRPPPTS
ncbi:uncharacterized protein EDB91DRAFT_1135339 [Suillus paluster]|uniref:uncharacterized protein n=1 Tax=Suillus paluster TaxID=48578 RepID=UPI001B86AF4F|nr:uncharacterized protein EDB91DRAFT_1135339 [Suillus paluster]KAG1739454.1 hypothetical protein EDB91DRAFT_1135339 [Suillus paluster]